MMLVTLETLFAGNLRRFACLSIIASLGALHTQ